MAQLPCIGLYEPCIRLPFGDCAMYCDHGVTYQTYTVDGSEIQRAPVEVGS